MNLKEQFKSLSDFKPILDIGGLKILGIVVLVALVLAQLICWGL
jgi:hypothetical protein